jgi:hypothetical protein
MTPEIIKLLERIAAALERLAPPPTAPNYQASLEEFKNFNWEKIGATVEFSDYYGVALVRWQGQLYKRRSPENAYKTAIFFSRCTGKDEEGRNQYERLITFKEPDTTIQPISRKAEQAIG